ncbi:MAG TPA: hypothetical protein VFI62_03685, partial [Burkholderiales bacterium]|nr:hypothetical protein [Burkholderiales bacterium]
MIPGRALHRLGHSICSPDMRERVVDAFVADFQRECVEAVTFRARASALVRGYASFWVALAGGLIHDARFDFGGFKTRVAIPLAFMGVMVGL